MMVSPFLKFTNDLSGTELRGRRQAVVQDTAARPVSDRDDRRISARCGSFAGPRLQRPAPVAQSGQSSGLLIRSAQVRILSGALGVRTSPWSSHPQCAGSNPVGSACETAFCVTAQVPEDVGGDTQRSSGGFG